MKKTCLNPACKKSFEPGHYGPLQLVCSGATQVKCKGRTGCGGTGKTQDGRCRRCLGKGAVPQTCKEWYQKYWVSTRRTPRGIPEDDLERLFKAVEKDLFWFSLLMVAARTGMRKGEFLGLTWGDVLDGGEVKTSFVLRGQYSDEAGGFVPTKTGASRNVYLLSDAREALTDYRKEYAKSVGKATLADRIWSASESSVWKWFTALQRRIKIKNPETGRPYRVHDLRHTAAINTIKATGKLIDASTLLGHKNPATTMIYTAQRPEDFVAHLEKSFGRKK